MRYERLTFLLDGKIYYEGYHNLLVSRLYDLEDKIESGELVNVCDYIHEERANKDRKIEELEKENAALRERLEKAVELKAKVGDTIYMPWVYGGISGIAVLEVLYMFMLTDKMEYNTDIESDDIAFTSLYNFGKFHDDDFGKVVFTTREAAEARLAELKGESK